MAFDIPPLPLYERVFGTAWIKWLRVLRDRFVIGENWQYPDFVYAWVDYYASPIGNYYKDALGTVHFRGLIKSGVPGPSSPAFILPEGYRPELPERFPVVANGAFGYITVQSNGVVNINAGSATWTSLAGITFKAA